ncbi:MAG: GIY-YIG nuclease family protein [Telluria sp.]
MSSPRYPAVIPALPCRHPRVTLPSFPRRRESKFGTYPRRIIDNHQRPMDPACDDVEMDKSSYVYILASEPYGVLYIGVTSNLIKRVWEHREGVVDGFSKQHGVKLLVWFEVHAEILEAIRREKQIKKWNRDWKVNLIQGVNPDWRDLYDEISF